MNSQTAAEDVRKVRSYADDVQEYACDLKPLWCGRLRHVASLLRDYAALLEANERLQAEHAHELANAINNSQEIFANQIKYIETLRAELAEARRLVEAYRWLKNNFAYDAEVGVWSLSWSSPDPLFAASLDWQMINDRQAARAEYSNQPTEAT